MNRRGFLAGGAGLAAASIAVPRAAAPALAAPAAPTAHGSLFPPDRIGIQLYSVADQISANGFAKTLDELARIGYKLVEFAGYEQTPAISTRDLRKLLDDSGLKPIGSHVSPSDDESMKKILEDAAVLGIPSVGISLPLPSEGPTVAGWTALSQTYNRFGEMAAREGVGFYLHNHFHEWFPTDDPTRRGEDILLAETDPRYVFFEMDIYWSYVGQWQSGQILQFDPLTDYAIPFKDRYRLFHVKDGRKDLLGGYTDAFANLVDAGQGSIDFQGFFDTLFAQDPDEVNRHHYIWERDNASDHPRGSMAAARSSFTYIRHGLYGSAAATPAAAENVPGAVTRTSFRRTKSGRRVLRVTIETDETVAAKFAVRRSRKNVATARGRELAAGRHTVDVKIPRKVKGGRAELVVTLGGHVSRLAVVVPAAR